VDPFPLRRLVDGDAGSSHLHQPKSKASLFSFKILPRRPGGFQFPLLAEGRSSQEKMTRVKEPSTPAGGEPPWKGRLRSFHATPQSLPPQRLHSRAQSRAVAEEARTSTNRVAPKIPRRGGSRDGDAGVARPLRAPTRRSPRLAGRDPEHPIVIDGEDKVGDCSLLEYSSSIRRLRNVLFLSWFL
jgi:hypothetical protein